MVLLVVVPGEHVGTPWFVCERMAMAVHVATHCVEVVCFDICLGGFEVRSHPGAG